MRILVSACLLGYNCKYNGKNNYNSKIVELLKEHEVVPVPLELMEESTSVSTVSSNNTSYLELYAHGVTLRVTEATSETLLAKVLEVLAHVE